ncbi:hypothetical protein BDW72DRAFT_170304 [Aspergillus terricola var. indicus]
MVTRRDPAVTTLCLGAVCWVLSTSLAYRYTSMSGTIEDLLKQDDGGKSQRCSFPSTPTAPLHHLP